MKARQKASKIQLTLITCIDYGLNTDYAQLRLILENKGAKINFVINFHFLSNFTF